MNYSTSSMNSCLSLLPLRTLVFINLLVSFSSSFSLFTLFFIFLSSFSLSLFTSLLLRAYASCVELPFPAPVLSKVRFPFLLISLSLTLSLFLSFSAFFSFFSLSLTIPLLFSLSRLFPSSHLSLPLNRLSFSLSLYLPLSHSVSMFLNPYVSLFSLSLSDLTCLKENYSSNTRQLLLSCHWWTGASLQARARWTALHHLDWSRSWSDCLNASIDRVWTIGSRSRLVKMGHLDPSRPCLVTTL